MFKNFTLTPRQKVVIGYILLFVIISALLYAWGFILRSGLEKRFGKAETVSALPDLETDNAAYCAYLEDHAIQIQILFGPATDNELTCEIKTTYRELEVGKPYTLQVTAVNAHGETLTTLNGENLTRNVTVTPKDTDIMVSLHVSLDRDDLKQDVDAFYLELVLTPAA